MFLLKKVFKQLLVDNFNTVSSFAMTNQFAKMDGKCVKAVNSPQVNKEEIFQFQLFV